MLHQSASKGPEKFSKVEGNTSSRLPRSQDGGLKQPRVQPPQAENSFLRL